MSAMVSGSNGYARTSALKRPELSSTQEAQLSQLDENPSGTPLGSAWTLYHDIYNKSSSPEEYASAVGALYTFRSAEGFWHVQHCLPGVPDMEPKHSYHVMREGVMPLWEDPANVRGGFWLFRSSKSDTARVWQQLLLLALGEGLPLSAPGDRVNGVSVSVRTYDDLVMVWNVAGEESAGLIPQLVAELLPNVSFRSVTYRRCESHLNFDGTAARLSFSAGSPPVRSRLLPLHE